MAKNEVAAKNPADEVQMLKNELAMIQKQNIAYLGDGQVFIKRLPGGGHIRPLKGPVTLEESNGEIAAISGKYMTTGKGFYKANQLASLNIITPKDLTLDTGQVVVNPYPVIDPESGTIRKFWVKKMAIGYGPTGNLVLTSATLLYDINMYFIQDLVKKVQYNAGAGRICFEHMLTEDEKQTGIFYKFDGPLGVWANVQHKEILKAIDTFINKKNFAERNAQTIAERVVMSKHPALSHITYVNATGPEKHAVAKVPIIGFIHDLSREQLEDIAAQAENGEEIKINGRPVEKVETVVTASAEDMVVDVDDEEIIATSEPSEEDAPMGGLFDTGGERL